jgi:MarR family transcriptional regulator, organic hydroperoxide resistance regulator
MEMDPAGNPQAPELEPALEFMRILWSLDHALQRASIRMESRLGVTAQQRFVIRLLGKMAGASPAQLADLLHVDRSSITALLKRLEGRLLVSREPDAHDGRRVRLSLTARGKKLDVPTRASVEHAVATVLAQSTAADIAAVRRVLGRLVAALDDVVAPSVEEQRVGG